MLKQFAKATLVAAVMFNLTANYSSSAFAAAPNPDDVARLSTLDSAFEDFDSVADFAKKAVVRLELLDLFAGETHFYPKEAADYAFAQRTLGTLDYLGEGNISFAEAKQMIYNYLIEHDANETISFQGFLNKKAYSDDSPISREDFAYMVAQARQIDLIEVGTPIHNPAIATPGPLLGPTVYQSGADENGPIFDGSTVSIFHRAKGGFNTSFAEEPQLTLQVHPEVFKSVSVGGIGVEALQDLSAQLEVELEDGSLHRTPLTSMVPFSIHGADGKAADVRIEDGILVLVDDLQGYVDSFELNGHTFTKEETVERMLTQSYYNGDRTNEQVLAVVTGEIEEKGFSLKDRRLMLHNLILTKTALQQTQLTPLSAPFNTIAGPSSATRGFMSGHLYSTYALAVELMADMESGNESAVRSKLSDPEVQDNLLKGTKILTATTLLPLG